MDAESEFVAYVEAGGDMDAGLGWTVSGLPQRLRGLLVEAARIHGGEKTVAAIEGLAHAIASLDRIHPRAREGTKVLLHWDSICVEAWATASLGKDAAGLASWERSSPRIFPAIVQLAEALGCKDSESGVVA